MPRHPILRSIGALMLQCVAAAALAQTPSPAESGPAASEDGMRIERLRTEDSGSRIDETRVRGETQSITVTPKGGMPVYRVLPSSANRPPASGARSEAGARGVTRVWTLFDF